MYFEIVGEITDIEIIAVESSIRNIKKLRERYGEGRWPKLKGKVTVSPVEICARLSFIGMRLMV